MPSFPFGILISSSWFASSSACWALPHWPKCRWTCFHRSTFRWCMVATFYSGMPPQQIEADITDTFERFFTLAGGVDHMESRSLTGVSLIKIYFQPGTDANADVTQISNLAMADLRTPAAGHAAARGDEGGCVEPAGVPADGRGTGPGRDATPRLPAILDSQSDCRRSRSDGSSALRRKVPSDHGVRRPAQVAGASIEPHGCGARHGLVESDSAGRRCSHRTIDYNIYTNAQVAERRRPSTTFRSRPTEKSPFLFPTWAKPWTALRCNTTSCA